MVASAKHEKLDRLIRSREGCAPLRTAIAHPCDAISLTAVIEAKRVRLIEPILVGPLPRIRALAIAHKLDLGDTELVDVPHSHAAAEMAVRLVRAGKADGLMKGSLHTDELMSEVMRKDTGLRTERRVSHVFVMDVPTYPKLLLITDGAVNLFPSLEDKRDIVLNAIDLAHALGIERPKIAILSAVETVTSKLPATIDAAALCKMAERGQITGALLDGPLALDNAINRGAAAEKHIVSNVAGDADVLLAPNLEAGNLLAKELTFLANAATAGLVLGASAPIILTSRADSVLSHLASCALAGLYRNARPSFGAIAVLDPASM